MPEPEAGADSRERLALAATPSPEPIGATKLSSSTTSIADAYPQPPALAECGHVFVALPEHGINDVSCAEPSCANYWCRS